MVFTNLYIKSLEPRDKIYEVWEGGQGFGMRINPGGRKTWQYVYRIGGRQRRLRLGVYPIVGLADARQRFLTLPRCQST